MATSARYALRYETAEGTLEAPWHHMARKADALRAAKAAAASCACPDVVRVHVDDAQTDLAVASFPVVSNG